MTTVIILLVWAIVCVSFVSLKEEARIITPKTKDALFKKYMQYEEVGRIKRPRQKK